MTVGVGSILGFISALAVSGFGWLLRREVNNRDKEIEELESRVGSLENKLNDHATALEGVKAAVESMSKEIGGLRGQVSDLNRNLMAVLQGLSKGG